VQSQPQASTVRVLAMTNRTRAPAAPDIPIRGGFPALSFDGLDGLFGPPDTGDTARERIAADIRAVAADPVVAVRLFDTGQILNPGNAAEFAAAIEEQQSKIIAIARRLDVKPEQ
jgi:tripartite-type tricarboxylate transporter receptor subunit TctC